MGFDFSKQTVIVSGGTRGIGRATSEAFLRAGASVIASYLGNAEAAAAFQRDWKDYPLELARFDVSDYKQVEDFFTQFDKSHPQLHVLVNNAGIRKDNIVGMMPPEDWRAVLDTNLTGTYNMSKFAVMRMMPGRFGRIICVSSPSGKIGFMGQANYAAAKAGQVAFAKSLSKETAKKGITVNCISPGFIETELIADLPEELRKEYRGMVPMKRFGQASEVAESVLFLASKEAAYITGTVLEVTGGL
ncbi:MAG: beta-ketoacyl-ACP reductase [Lentisphaerae bacterium GWF2_52_8]|nr:MAG: beta-ketoacyl-ACP reductase [Lentisphaerae bacterium GWF2_52_8]